MENRFGVKDLVVMLLLLGVILSIWLAMVMFNRQWELVQELNGQVSQLTKTQTAMRRDIGGLRSKLDEGVIVSGAGDLEADSDTPAEAIQMTDPFERIKIARASEGFAEGDWMIDAFGTTVAKITPLVTSDAYSRRIQTYVLEGLLTRDPETLEEVPLIAKSWQISDDGLTITYQLREDVYFSDGEPLTSEDVVFSFELLNNPDVNAPSLRDFYEPIASCEANGPYEVVFKMKRPHYLALGMTGSRNVLPKHFYEKYPPDEFNKLPGLLLGSGPYRMKNAAGWTPGQPLELVRNERYWGEQSGFDKLLWREVTNDVARLNMFRNGEVDVLSLLPEQYVKLKKDPEEMKGAQEFVYYTRPTGYSFIAWNQKRDGKSTKFADKRVRQAMTFLTPRQQMAKQIYYGFAKPADGPYFNGGPQEDPNIKARPFNVEKGKALLAEAGWEDRDGDGVLENSDGEKFSFKLTYPASSDTYNKVVLALKDAYARVGIVLVPDPLEFSVMLQRLDSRDFDAISLGWGGGAVEGDIRQTFHTEMIETGDNFMSYSNPELDELIDLAARTVAKSERLPIWHKTHQILYEDQPYTFLFTRESIRLINDRIHNVHRVSAGLNDPTEWFVPTAEQKYTAE
ncbi:Oligopeptide-binding protein AppA precursor [Poriferisphaera corsica]|uniref:Oligopeptide-binding protein AppA n=1 Tax=Poriferisphaera corsica TaxID=2528020 RepID=A0A517YWU0_9BACT|nr:ABC transporter substrate-binding protein [Poriferisphaera corsica]QDU34680.1 Oligopeptide-binding protein AppA precursor [Poriferisphaera corsica]